MKNWGEKNWGEEFMGQGRGGIVGNEPGKVGRGQIIVGKV